VWSIILSGILLTLAVVFFVAYLQRLHSLPYSHRAEDLRLWNYRLCYLLLLAATAVTNFIDQLLNRPH
jgi:uncharacterized membrane protein YwzB